jgi:hypothetical protein
VRLDLASPLDKLGFQVQSLMADSVSAASSDPLHDFDAQKEVHQQIRNDPDYDDWEYGTEPLPHEAWNAKSTPKAQESGSAESST